MSVRRIHRRLTVEELEPRIAPGVAVAYVDDDYNSSTPGWGVDHFALIQNGINAVNTDGTVNVGIGVYNETVSLGKSATVTLSPGATTIGSIVISNGVFSATGCNLRVTGNYSESGGTFTSAPTQGSFTVGGSFSLSGGTFNRFGDGNLIYDVYALQAMKLNLAASYKLANDVDASTTSAWYDGEGFEPVGWDSSHPFAGSFDGNNKHITGLTINKPSQDYVGLFGCFAGGSNVISNVGLVGDSVRGSLYIGGLVGYITSGNVSYCYATGAVSGGGSVGGLVGYNSGSVSNSYAPGGVSGGGSVGGLVGQNIDGIISTSYATGGVTGGGGYYVGGLVGQNLNGSVSDSYATGGVTGGWYVGGLVGRNGFGSGTASVSNSYATGGVTGGWYVGGLVGYNAYGILSNCLGSEFKRNRLSRFCERLLPIRHW